MGGDNGDGNRTGQTEWAEWERERGKGGAGASGASSGERRAKMLCWWVLFRSTGDSMWGRTPIQFEAYNIRNSRNGGLGLDLRGVLQANLDLGIFQYTKLTGKFYTCRLAGYSVVAMDAPI